MTKLLKLNELKQSADKYPITEDQALRMERGETPVAGDSYKYATMFINGATDEKVKVVLVRLPDRYQLTITCGTGMPDRRLFDFMLLEMGLINNALHNMERVEDDQKRYVALGCVIALDKIEV